MCGLISYGLCLCEQWVLIPFSSGGARSIIDYFIVKKALRPGVADVKVIRGAELDSNHYLVLMKVSLKPRKPRKETGVTRQKLRVNKLAGSSIRRRFQLELSSRFRQRRCVSGDGVERVWQEFRDLITEATEKVVDRSKKRRVKKRLAGGVMR